MKSKQPLSEDERQKILDDVRQHSDRLTELARAYDRLKYLAERTDPNPASDAFLQIAAAAGEMTEASLQQLATLLELLRRAGAIEGQTP